MTATEAGHDGSPRSWNSPGDGGVDSKITAPIRTRTFKSVLALVFARGVEVILSLAVSVLMADKLGANSATDAFFLARRLVTNVNMGIKELAHTIFMPSVVTELRRIGESGVRRLFLPGVARAMIIATAAIGVVAYFAPWMVSTVAPGFEQSQISRSVEFIRILLFTVPLSVVIAFSIISMNAAGRFTYPAFVQRSPQVFLIIALLFFVAPFGPIALPWALLLGTTLTACVFLPYVAGLGRYKIISEDRKADSATTPLAYSETAESTTRAKHPARRETLGVKKRVLPTFLDAGYSFGSAWLDVAFISTLGVGLISSFEYGSRLSSIIPNVVLSSLMTVLYTSFSHAAAEQTKELQRDTTQAARTTFFVMVPIVIILFVTAEDLVALVLMRGAFGQEQADNTATFVRWFVLIPLFNSIRRVLVVAVFTDPTLPLTKIVGSSVFIGLAVRVGALLVLVAPFGILGVALCAIASEFALLAALMAQVASYWNDLIRIADVRAIAKTFAAGAVTFAVSVAVANTMWTDLAASYWDRAIHLASSAAVVPFVYLAVSWLLGSEELRFLLRKLGQR